VYSLLWGVKFIVILLDLFSVCLSGACTAKDNMFHANHGVYSLSWGVKFIIVLLNLFSL
jgi:hypothetical protein